MHRLFLDANVLFSAAYPPDAGVRRLWNLPACTLVTSEYAIEEARRNLGRDDQLKRLDALLRDLERAPSLSLGPEMRGSVELPEKDWPILGGAVTAGATHLITGDHRHFGPYFGRAPLGVEVLTPGAYLARCG